MNHRLSVCLLTVALGGCYSADCDCDGGGQAGSSNNGGDTGAAASSGRGGEAGSGEGGDSSGGITSGGRTSGGSTSGGGTSGGSPNGGSAGGGDPLCASMDSDGFFSDCLACGDDCDTIDDGTSRNACGCSSGCPCGLTCGCYDIAPNVGVCDICVQ